MDKAATMFLVLACLVSGVGAKRSKETIRLNTQNEAIVTGTSSNKEMQEDAGAMFEDDAAEENMFVSAGTADFCASSRCDGYTDADAASDKQLKFRFADRGLDFDPMSRAEVANEMRYEGYEYGVLTDCRPVENLFSSSRDWAVHMQTNMRDGIWPNNPGENQYKCVERCRLETFNANRKQLNQGNEPEVWVERGGNSGDFIDKMFFSPATCTVGNSLQQHWWKQHLITKSSSYPQLMVDPQGLPVFPHLAMHDDLAFLREEQFAQKFCALTKEEKISVVKRVTKHRPNPVRYGKYYDSAMLRLKARNYFPKGFPTNCWSDGWKAATAEGISKDLEN